MKSKLEIRKFAVEQAVAIMGTGTPQKDVVSKAKEIEVYVLGDAVLPEVQDEVESVKGVLGTALQMFGELIPPLNANEFHDGESNKE